MAKVLREDNNNRYAKAIREVENFMRDKGVSLEFYGSMTVITILDKEFELNCSMGFPRLYEGSPECLLKIRDS